MASTLAKVPLRTSWLVYLGIETGGNSMKVEECSGSSSGLGGMSAGTGVDFFSCSLPRMWTSSVMLSVWVSILSLSLPIFVSNKVPIWFTNVFAAAWL